MKTTRLGAAAIAVACAAFLCVATAASAAVVTIGSPLKGSFTWPALAVQPTTYANGTLANSAAPLVSPVDGAVIRWRLSEGFFGGPFQLEVVSPGGQGSWVSGAASTSVSGSEGTFPTDLPIQKGQGIALNAPAGSALGVRLSAATQNADFFEWSPQLTPAHDSGAYTNFVFHQEIGFNADVLPAPTVAAISAPLGAVAGGTKVTITGTDFTEVTKVKFGATAATSYKVESEGKIVAVAPAGNPSATVGVSVTTVAGTAKAPSRFAYAAPPSKATKPSQGKKGKAKRS